MVNKPLIRPYFLGGVALGGVARIPMIKNKIPNPEDAWDERYIYLGARGHLPGCQCQMKIYRNPLVNI